MKKSELTFIEGFTSTRAEEATKQGKIQMAFNWDIAAKEIKKHLKAHPDLIAEAGLQNDWSCTGGIIFEDGKPTNDNYTYLCSNWAVPTLILSWDGEEQIELACSTPENERFGSDSKWDKISLKELGINLVKKVIS